MQGMTGRTVSLGKPAWPSGPDWRDLLQGTQRRVAEQKEIAADGPTA